MLKNIMSSIHEPPSSTSSCSTEQMLKNIQNSSRVPGSPIYTSSPSDVSLWEDDIEDKKPVQQYHQMMREQGLDEESSDDNEYQPPLIGLEEDQERGLDIGSEEGEESDFKNKLG
jgi:hypothetical protein